MLTITLWFTCDIKLHNIAFVQLWSRSKFTIIIAEQRFQKAYSTLNRELVEEKKQLSNIHEQRVQAKLNEKKAAAMDNYMDELNDDTSEVRELLPDIHQIYMIDSETYVWKSCVNLSWLYRS